MEDMTEGQDSSLLLFCVSIIRGAGQLRLQDASVQIPTIQDRHTPAEYTIYNKPPVSAIVLVLVSCM